MLRGLAVLLALLPAAPVSAQDVDHVETILPGPEGYDPKRPAWPETARLTAPAVGWTNDLFGGLPAWTVLEVSALACGACRHGFEDNWVRLPDGLVFEDVAPRLWDVTGDGRPEIVVVESASDAGARLAVWSYAEQGGDLTRLASTDFAGTPQRWLAPAGVGDFDGDGQLEIAYVDGPHDRGDLVLVRQEGERLVETARLPGVTNHRIGDRVIRGGVRDCGAGPELILASMDWTRVLRVKGREVEDIGPMPTEGLTIPPC